jgi:adenylate cyclase class 2
MREIEVKIRTDDLSLVREKLEERNCHFSEPIHQHDIIYTIADEEIWTAAKEGDIAIRIRQQDDGSVLNLKQQKTSELDNLEYETRVDNPEAVRKILATLGYIPQVEVKKVRTECKLNGYTVCLDEVEQLGTFVEIEKMSEEGANPAEIQEELLKVAESIGLLRQNLEPKGYDTMTYLLGRR